MPQFKMPGMVPSPSDETIAQWHEAGYEPCETCSGLGHLSDPGYEFDECPMCKGTTWQKIDPMKREGADDVDAVLAGQSKAEEDRAQADYKKRARQASDPDLKKLFMHTADDEHTHEDEFDQFDESAGGRTITWSPGEYEANVKRIFGKFSSTTSHAMALRSKLMQVGDYGQVTLDDGELSALSELMQAVVSNSRGPERDLAEDVLQQIGYGSSAPTMESVFRMREALPPARPVMGSKPTDPRLFQNMGKIGQTAKTQLDTMKDAGQEVTPYSTPEGDVVAWPKNASDKSQPLKLDPLKGGIWSPVTDKEDI